MSTNFGSDVVNGQAIDVAHVNALRAAVLRLERGVPQFCPTVAGTVNAITASAGPPTLIGGDLVAGLRLEFLPTGANTAAVTLNVDSTGAIAINKYGTVALDPGDLRSGMVAQLVYDGTNFQLQNPLSGRIVNGGTSAGTQPAYTLTIAGMAAGEIVTGLTVVFHVHSSSTSAATLNINSTGALNIHKRGDVATVSGDLLVGQLAMVTYDGTNFQLLNPQV